ncbi:nose resistant to fluoxetine protein 6-like isoform X3 [Onthophagus taurus]|uniref:nose resistant to fluoxetine protein 6-like isoform X3 n=1 Tax=Onthophagus taurus TaxID=166361 RepID=UPI0039BE5BD3
MERSYKISRRIYLMKILILIFKDYKLLIFALLYKTTLAKKMLRRIYYEVFDASAKFPVGVFDGNRNLLGNFPQCMRVEYKKDGVEIYGKHCLAGLVSAVPDITVQNEKSSSIKTVGNSLGPRSVFQNYININKTKINSRSGYPIEDTKGGYVTFSICIPDACTPSEVHGYFSLQLPLDVQNIFNQLVAPNDDALCQSEPTMEGFSNVDLAFCIFIGVIILLNVCGTLYDVQMTRKGKEPSQWFLAFSFVRNFKELHNVSTSANRISCLDGLRVFSIFWVILGHRFSIAQVLPYVNADYVWVWAHRMYSQYAQGAGSAVDSFLFLSGLLSAMLFIKSQSRPNAKFNIIMFWVHRYLRLTPALAIVYFLHVSVYVHFGSGPVWPMFVHNLRDKCLERWASFFFYYQNYLDSNGMCLLHTWYLSMDMQIFILSPIVLIPLVKYRKIMLKIILPILLAASMIVAWVIPYVYDTPIFSQPYYDYSYYPMHTRLSAWLVGIIAGTLLHEFRDAKLTIPWWLNLFIWACVVVGMIACVFPGNTETYDYNRVTSAFYLAFHRPAWAIGLTWVVFACMKGRGGIFNWVLSIGIFQTLSKLTYSMYLVHISSLLLSVAKMQYEGQFGDFELIHMFLGDLLQVVTIALIWYVLFESPMTVIEKIIFGGGAKRRPRPAATNGASAPKVEA